MYKNYLQAKIMAERKMSEEYINSFRYKYSDYILKDNLVILEILNVKKDYFELIKNILETEFCNNHNKGGRKPKLSIEDKIMATIEYYSSNCTYLKLSKKYKIHESNMFDNINWVVNTLVNKKIAIVTKDNYQTVIGLYYKKLDKLLEKK